MTKEELEDLILVQKLSYEEIGRKEGISGAGIKKRAKKFGISLPKRRVINPSEWAKFGHIKYTEIMTCPICGKTFRKRWVNNICCSKECGGKYTGSLPRTPKEKPVWDGVEKEDMWKYDHVVDNHGYLYTMCPQHPKALKNGYIYLHRLIVENHIGRLLKDDEVIHHKDLNKRNNSIDNLMVLTPSEHSKLHWELKHQGIV